jgi:hypothetical protein
MDKLGEKRGLVAGMLALVAMAACGDSTGVGVGESLTLNFRVNGASGPAAAPARVGPVAVAGPPMVITGSNGTLTLSEIRLVIDKVELELADASCGASGSTGGSGDDSGQDSADDDSHEHCGEFEAGPRFLDLPLDGEPVEAVTATIPAGTYSELKFKIEDLEDDEEDAAEAAAIAEVRATILAQFPDWPRKASGLVVGTFQPIDGDPVDFRVYLEAEVEIEMDLVPNLVVDDTGVSSRDLTVDVSPSAWFTNPDGTVVELQLHDYDATGELLELEVEMEHGFTEIEFDD